MQRASVTVSWREPSALEVDPVSERCELNTFCASTSDA
jgi:hypothetical protein